MQIEEKQMYTLFLIVHVIVSLFLIFIILVQSGKGEGLSDVFGGGSSQTTIFGARTGNFLTKATTASAIIFMLTCLCLAFMSRRQTGGSVVEQDLKTREVQKIIDKVVKGAKEEVETQVEKTAQVEAEAVPVPSPAPVAAAEASSN